MVELVEKNTEDILFREVGAHHERKELDLSKRIYCRIAEADNEGEESLSGK